MNFFMANKGSGMAYRGHTVNRALKLFTVGFVLVLVQACVTTTTGKNPKHSKQHAVEANVKLGMAYLQKGDRENALRAFNSAIEQDKKSAEAHQGMALIHQRNGESERAEKSFKKALKGRADFSKSSVRISYGRFLYSQERYKEALEFFETSAEDITYVGRAKAFYHLGLTHKQLGNPLIAKASFDRALNIRANSPGAAIELATMSFDEKDFSSAQKYLAKFIEANQRPTARSLWLSIQIERIFGNEDKEASSALALKNLYPYSNEYLLYKNSLK